MIVKNKVDINSTNWESFDIFKRKLYIENLTKLIENTDEQFVLSINAPWGYGKTTFIKMWKAYLETQDFTTLYFNAWENDYAKDPFLSIFSEIFNQIENQNPTKQMLGKLNNAKNIAKKLFAVGANVGLKAATLNALDTDTIKDVVDLSDINDNIASMVGSYAESTINNYKADKDVHTKFREAL